MAAVSIEVRGADQLARTAREAAALLDDTRTPDQAVASLVGPVAVATTPRRTGRTAAAVRFGVGPVGPTVEVPVPHAIPLHWGAPANHQAAQPWVSRAWATREEQIVGVYEDHATRAVDHVTT